MIGLRRENGDGDREFLSFLNLTPFGFWFVMVIP